MFLIPFATQKPKPCLAGGLGRLTHVSSDHSRLVFRDGHRGLVLVHASGVLVDLLLTLTELWPQFWVFIFLPAKKESATNERGCTVSPWKIYFVRKKQDIPKENNVLIQVAGTGNPFRPHRWSYLKWYSMWNFNVSCTSTVMCTHSYVQQDLCISLWETFHFKDFLKMLELFIFLKLWGNKEQCLLTLRLQWIKQWRIW